MYAGAVGFGQGPILACKLAVVSIGLFWVSFMPFSYSGVYYRPAQSGTISSNPAKASLAPTIETIFMALRCKLHKLHPLCSTFF